MSSQPIVQWSYIIYIHIRGSFLSTFCTSICERVHNSKEFVNMQDLFVLAVGYVDMTTYPLTKYYYIIERVYFIYRLFILFISIFSFSCFYNSITEV